MSNSRDFLKPPAAYSAPIAHLVGKDGLIDLRRAKERELRSFSAAAAVQAGLPPIVDYRAQGIDRDELRLCMATAAQHIENGAKFVYLRTPDGATKKFTPEMVRHTIEQLARLPHQGKRERERRRKRLQLVQGGRHA